MLPGVLVILYIAGVVAVLGGTISFYFCLNRRRLRAAQRAAITQGDIEMQPQEPPPALPIPVPAVHQQLSPQNHPLPVLPGAAVQGGAASILAADGPQGRGPVPLKALPALREESLTTANVKAPVPSFSRPLPRQPAAATADDAAADFVEVDLGESQSERRERAYSEASAKLEGTWEGYGEEEEKEIDYSKINFDS